jgi:hypothetical protein
VTKRLLLPGLLCLLSGLDAGAQTRELRETFGGSVNTIGVQNNLDLSWTWKLSSSTSPLLSDAHVAVGLTDSLSPAYNRLGAWVELSPLSILDLRAGLEPAVYFGTFSALTDYASYDDVFDVDTRKARDKAGDKSFGTGGRTYVGPTLKLKLGRVVAVSSAEFEWWRASNDGPFFYEPTRDLLLKTDGDSMVVGQNLLLLEIPRPSGGRILVGPVHGYRHVYDAPQNRVQTLGVLGVYELAERRFGVKKPTVILQVSRYLEDRWKDGELTAQLAVRFTK